MNDQQNNDIFKILIEIHKEIGVMKSEVAEVKVDLKEHMRRTAVAEARLDKTDEVVRRITYTLQGVLAVLGVISTMAAIYHYLKP